MPESLSPHATLRKILEHEQRLGFRDSAVSGGLAGYVLRFLEKLPEVLRKDETRLRSLFADYATLDPSWRATAVSQALLILDGQAQSTLPLTRPAPSLPPAAETSNGGAKNTMPPATANSVTGAKAAKRTKSSVVTGTKSSVVRGTKSVVTGTTASISKPKAASASSSPPTAEKVAPKPAFSSKLDVPVTRLPGVGPAYAKHLQRLAISSVLDLLYHFPRRHVDYRVTKRIKDLSIGQIESVVATVWEVHARRARTGRTVIEMVAGDETGVVGAVWFNQPHLAKTLLGGRQVMLSGRVEVGSRGQPYLKTPDWELLADGELVHAGRLVPVHPLTEGLSGRWLRRLIKNAIDRRLPELLDHLPAPMLRAHNLLDLQTAIAQMHFPDNEEIKDRAVRRLAFDELLVIQIGVLARRQAWVEGQQGHSFHIDRALVEQFLASLPFELTSGQAHASADILEDMASAQPMTRLLEGEVGSGKTVVAALATLVAAANGCQSVLMAPTEILAEQHYHTLRKLLTDFPLLDRKPGLDGECVHVRLLTGSVRKREKEAIYQQAAIGEIDVLVGTSAVIQEGLELAHLGLAIIDEQHRFGVMQRGSLRQKGFNPDLLVMTATPIPRTLALTLYGDLDISTIRELPPGRPDIRTKVLRPDQRQSAYHFVRRKVALGEQVFVICPLVEESEKIEARAAIAEYERLRTEVFPDLRLGLLHGRMSSYEKDSSMRAFRDGETQVLVSTAVVEVGIDVPNATVMLIEGADRFGLAQLHQFRGRVGRGTAESYCILLSDSATAEAEERLQVVARTRDGSLLAEEDLRLRGPGEFFGTRQSGLPDLKVASLADVALLEQVRDAAKGILARDPNLEAPEHRLLGAKVAGFWSSSGDAS